jgi:ABC-2 type transport system ATP-binding protein
MSLKPAINLDGLVKNFHVRRVAAPGFLGLARALLSTECEVIRAVDAVSFAIARGERVAFIGPNGAGKSTTLKILAGILTPDAGQVEVLGMAPARERQQIAYVIGTLFGQRSQLWYQLPARDTLRLLSAVYELDRRVAADRIEELSELLGLQTLLDRPVRQLSLGERMRCELAASLLHRPGVLFLDEPTIGLDVAAKSAFRTALGREATERNMTLLLTSHDTSDIEQLCDRVIVIHRGRLVMDGPIGELRRNYLRKKRIMLLTEQASVRLELPGVTSISSAAHQHVVELDLTVSPVAAVIDAALQQTELRDVTVEDPPLDEVIRALYARVERTAAS